MRESRGFGIRSTNELPPRRTTTAQVARGGQQQQPLEKECNVVDVHWCEMNMVRSFIVSGSCGTRSPRCSIVWWSGRSPSISMNVKTDMTKNG